MTKRVRLGERFGGLSARLIVSYVLVTLVTMGALILFIGIGQYIQDTRSPANRDSVAQVLRGRAPLLAHYLDMTPPNLEEVQNRLGAYVLDPLFANANRAVSFVGVWGLDGHILASADCGLLTQSSKVCALPASAASQAALATPGVRTIIHGVLAASGQSVDAPNAMPDGDSFAAVPILSKEGNLLGVVGAVYGAPAVASTSLEGDIAAYLSGLERNNWQYFLLLAMIIGTLAGMMISRGLRRRLRRITRAAEAWSQGDLAVAVRDPASDELGQLARDLDRMATQLQTLLESRKELAVVEERNRLARELHDTVKQHVFAGALLVRAARKLATRDPEKVQSYLADAEMLAGETQQELVALIAALRPASLADKGLVGVLRDEVGDWSRRTGIAVDLRVQRERTTPLDVEEALLRVTREALANVARHSDARQMDVRLVWEDEYIYLLVRDDGHGFDPERAAGQGVGLASMRERVEALGGTLTISGAPEGASIEAYFPVPISLPSASAAMQLRDAEDADRGGL